MDAVVRSLQETIQSSLSLSGALQGDPAASINPHILTAAEDVTRMAGNALFTLNAVNAAKASVSATKQAGVDLTVAGVLDHGKRRRDFLLIQQFI